MSDTMLTFRSKYPGSTCPFHSSIECVGWWTALARNNFMIDSHDCKDCGWNPEVEKWRKEKLHDRKFMQMINMNRRDCWWPGWAKYDEGTASS